jgi:hypothetical protein
MLILHDETDELAIQAFADRVRDHTLLDAAPLGTALPMSAVDPPTISVPACTGAASSPPSEPRSTTGTATSTAAPSSTTSAASV